MGGGYYWPKGDEWYLDLFGDDDFIEFDGEGLSSGQFWGICVEKQFSGRRVD